MSTPRIQESGGVQSLDADAELTIAASAQAASRAVHAGAHAPLFTLADAAGQHVALEDLLRAGPVVLHFFRGNWCSFSEESVSGLTAIYGEVIALGASAVAISPPCQHSAKGAAAPMRELQDIDMKVARAYGLAFELPAALRPKYAELGYLPPSTRKAGSWLVPLPATYLLDRDGSVALAFIDVDYRKPIQNEALLNALRAVQARHANTVRAAR
ncbi:peroxiredoxin-like family protein [Paraburkholderia caffeinilytica]|uniref:peroxiredoxin-like family protein n=1 Tax=Paraburkholderia caffeinilytica TaxID=1761016 RepID=UPI0038BB2117